MEPLSYLSMADVEDPRATDNAWIETVAVHMHCPYELGSELYLQAGEEVEEAAWVDVEHLLSSRRPLYANHWSWLQKVKQRMDSREASLASILVRWGRIDVAKRVLRDPELLEHRTVMLMQPAFQQAMERASSERNFNVAILDLLLDHGCTPSACNLAAIVET